MLHKGSCHCGHIAFEAEGDLAEVISCNCSICSRLGALRWFVPKDDFRLLTPEENLRVYTFNTHAVRHVFCPACGIGTYGERMMPNGPMVAVNVRCIEGIDPDSLTIRHYDGRSL